jgi:hypothetical protein
MMSNFMIQPLSTDNSTLGKDKLTTQPSEQQQLIEKTKKFKLEQKLQGHMDDLML